MSNLSELLPAGSSVKSSDFVAQGTLSSGLAVALRSDGKVEAIAQTNNVETLGNSAQAGTQSTQFFVSEFDATSNRFLIAYRDASNSNYGTMRSATISGSTLTFGAAYVFLSSNLQSYVALAYHPNSGKTFLGYQDLSDSNKGKGRMVTVSNTGVISYGTIYQFSSYVYGSRYDACYDATSGNILVAYADSGADSNGIVASISGNVISYGSAVEASTETTQWVKCIATEGGQVAISYDFGGILKMVLGNVSGTTITWASTITTSMSINTDGWSYVYDSTAQKITLAGSNAAASYYPSYRIGTISGSGTGASISWSGPTVMLSSGLFYVRVAYLPGSNTYAISWRLANNTYQVYGATLSGTTLSFPAAAKVMTTVGNIFDPTLAVDTTQTKVGMFLGSGSNANRLYGASFSPTYTSTNVSSYVGITDQAISNAATGKVVCKGGAITNTGLIPFAPSFGTASEFSAANTTKTAVAFDSSNNKIVVVYNNPSDSLYATAVVGTVSGSSITYGTPVRLRTSSIQYPSATFDSTANKVNIVFTNDLNGNRLECMTGTISGTSISVTSAILVNGSNGATYASSVFDVNANRLVICWVNTSNSSYGTAVVGTLNEYTQQSFGSPVVFNSASTSACAAVYDSNANKVVTGYQDSGNSGHGTAIVGTVSGTSISFGSEAVFESANSFLMAGTFDSNANKAVFTYQSGSKGKAVVGTVSGTSISFGSSVNFDESAAADMSNSFDTSSNKVVVCFRDVANSQSGTVVFGTVSGTSISFAASSAFTAGGTVANISTTFDSNVNKTIVAFVDGSDSTKGKALTITEANDLTPNTAYFVQDDGTISTTSSTTKAGTALSTTSLLLTG